MKIGVLGTGDVGRVLGAGFAERGHQLKIGTRSPGADKIRDWVARTGNGVSAGTFAEAAAFGEAVVLAVGWEHVEAASRMADPGNLAGKVVLDATNPRRFDAPGSPRCSRSAFPTRAASRSSAGFRRPGW